MKGKFFVVDTWKKWAKNSVDVMWSLFVESIVICLHRNSDANQWIDVWLKRNSIQTTARRLIDDFSMLEFSGVTCMECDILHWLACTSYDQDNINAIQFWAGNDSFINIKLPNVFPLLVISQLFYAPFKRSFHASVSQSLRRKSNCCLMTLEEIVLKWCHKVIAVNR